MSSSRVLAPLPVLEATFKPDIFKGKVLFCTGGGSGICKAMTEAIMKYGAHAAIVGRKLDRLEASAKEMSQSTGRKCLPLQGDVRVPAQLQAAAKKTVDEFGRIDFVICGAAGNFLAPISGISENAFKTVIEIDTLGTYNTVKATLPYIRQSKGSYIHVSATRHYRGMQYQAHMSAAKAAVDATSQCLAVEEGPFGVRSNVIAPGPIGGTEGIERLSKKEADGSSVSYMTDDSPIPLGRVGSVEDIAAAAVFLFSPAAIWITGTVLVVDGGERHMSFDVLPYPRATLDPSSVKNMIAAKL